MPAPSTVGRPVRWKMLVEEPEALPVVVAMKEPPVVVPAEAEEAVLDVDAADDDAAVDDAEAEVALEAEVCVAVDRLGRLVKDWVLASAAKRASSTVDRIVLGSRAIVESYGGGFDQAAAVKRPLYDFQPLLALLPGMRALLCTSPPVFDF